MSTTTVMVTGNLTRDPELRYTPSGTAVANMGVAVNRRKRNPSGEWVDDGADFYNVTAWRQLATNVAELGKGTRVVVTGRLTQRTWETDDGGKRYAVEVVADDIGASLAWATVEVTKNERRHPDQAPHPADDYADEPAGASNGSSYDPTEEPF